MKSFYRLLRYLVYFLFGLSVIGACSLYGAYLYLEPKLPSIETLKDVRLQVPLRIYSSDHLLIAEFGEKRREPLGYDDIPPRMIQAFLAAEDDRFFQHPGVDYHGIIRAAVQLLLTGERRQGGSTITMQVARNFFLSSEKTYTRKLNEIFLSFKIERLLSKEEILELY
ncbi:MAG: transglycosylase domain-containing protein, partial [Candidatus Thiodiazotropha taylori]|nr:transglycosylase domain-containing protein [Candidatus Thiodiazotropha taylori]MCW4255293.1 transglycosylase domain-containing protein [Candidatus Thiodiazotropha taylori]